MMMYNNAIIKEIKKEQKGINIMSCPNFITQKDFKLFLWDFERPTDEKLNEYICEINEDITNTPHK